MQNNHDILHEAINCLAAPEIDAAGADLQRAIYAAVVKPPLQLAKTYDPKKHDPADFLVSAKLDGVRGYWDGKAMWTRNGNPIALPPQWAAQLPAGFPLDGEIYWGPHRFAETLSITSSHDPKEKEWAKLRYCAFDAPAYAGDARARQSAMSDVFESLRRRHRGRRKHLVQVAQFVVKDDDALQNLLDKTIADGEEGLMLRALAEPYRPGRNAGLLKLKRMLDAEALVVDYQPGTGRHEGRVGALICQFETDAGEIVEFKVGTGLTDAERSAPPEIGDTITFGYQEILKSGAPRFPVFLRRRPTTDIPQPTQTALF